MGRIATLNKKAGIAIYGNYTSLSSNMKATIEKGFAERSWSGNTGTRSEYAETQLVDLGNPYNSELIKKIHNQFVSLVEDDDNILTGGSVVDGTAYRQNIKPDVFVENVPYASELITPNIVEQIESECRSHFIPTRIIPYRIHHVPPEVQRDKEVFSNWWHIDSGKPNHFKLFINLMHVTENHGPFHALPAPLTKKIARKRGIPRRLSDFSEINDGDPTTDVRTATGEAGSIMMCSTQNCLHRADVPAEGNHRDVIVIECKPSKEPVTDEWMEACVG